MIGSREAKVVLVLVAALLVSYLVSAAETTPGTATTNPIPESTPAGNGTTLLDQTSTTSQVTSSTSTPTPAPTPAPSSPSTIRLNTGGPVVTTPKTTPTNSPDVKPAGSSTVINILMVVAVIAVVAVVGFIIYRYHTRGGL